MPRPQNRSRMLPTFAALGFLLVPAVACTDSGIPSASQALPSGPSLGLIADDVDPTLHDDGGTVGVAFRITDYSDGILTAVNGRGEQVSAIFYPPDPIVPPNPIFPTDPIFPMLRAANLSKYLVTDVCRSAAAGYNTAMVAPPGSDIAFTFTSLIGCNAQVWIVKNAVPPNPIRAFRPVP